MTQPSLPEESLFGQALEIGNPAERAAFLDRACGDNAALRAEVEALLQAHEKSGDVLDLPERPPATIEAPVIEKSGTVIGPYKLLEQIGEGGMGTVWMAQQTEPVKRVVALKVIKAGMDSKQIIARFEAERQALALMDHANIARVLDAGATVGGRPYFVMDLVKGVPITKYCDEHHLTPRQRLELFIPVCQAVQHAHQKGIIHRDLKPSNVLVALYDGKPVPKVIDFGVAKAAGQQLTDKTLVTGFGAIVGTLEYMSPEQAEVNQLDIDTRSDIYSLGVVLYELLAGSPPFSRKELTQAGMLEMLRVIREEEPSKPSTKLSTAEGLPTLAANRGTEPAKLTKLVRGELDWIVMKALEKDRNRRYETANGFAMDVQRYLADEPVAACPPSVRYRFKKFARRNKGGLAVAALVLFFLVLLGSGVGWAVRDRAARHAKVAGEVESMLTEAARLESQQKWPEALAAVRRAEAALTGGEADAATAERVHERLRDLEFINRLEEIRVQRGRQMKGRKFDYANEDEDYARAFRDYGVDIDALELAASIDRLKAVPALAIPLVAALDNWADARHAALGRDAAKRLVAIARGIDPESLRELLRSTWERPPSEVQEELRRLADSIDIRAQHPATVVILANTLQKVNQSDTALRLLRDAQFAYPGDFWVSFHLGGALTKQKDFEAAIRFYTAAVSIRPNSSAALSDLGNALHGQKRLEEAIACFRKAIELDPKNAKAYNNLGNALSDQKKLDEAVACFRKAIELEPKYAIAYGNLGIALRDQKKLGEAIAAFHRAIDIDPTYANVYVNLSVALYRQNKLDDAISACQKAIKIDRTIATAHYNLGYILQDQKKLDDAIVAYRKAIELDSKYFKAHYQLGSALRAQKRLDEALASYRKAVELDPSSASIYVTLANDYFNLGVALSGQKKPDEAIAAYKKAIDLHPKHADAHCNLGAHWCDDLKEYDKAIECFRKAIELNAEHINARRNLGYALWLKGWDLISPDRMLRDRNRALEGVQEAVDLAPRSAEAWRHFGWIQYRLGNLKGSIESLDKSCKLQPGGTGDAGQWIVMALAHAKFAAQEGLPDKEREHHKGEARRRFEQADKRIDSKWRIRPAYPREQAIWDFRAEARELMGAKDGKK